MTLLKRNSPPPLCAAAWLCAVPVLPMVTTPPFRSPSAAPSVTLVDLLFQFLFQSPPVAREGKVLGRAGTVSVWPCGSLCSFLCPRWKGLFFLAQKSASPMLKRQQGRLASADWINQ